MLARCLIRTMMLISATTMANVSYPNAQAAKGVAMIAMIAARDEIRVASGDDEPDHREHSGGLPRDRKQDAEVGRDAFSTFEFQPNRKVVTEQRAETGEHCRHLAEVMIRDQDCGGALRGVEQQASPRRGPCGRCAAHWSHRYCPIRYARTSPRPAARVSSRPNGIEPKKYPDRVLSAALEVTGVVHASRISVVRPS